jgi:hypothetical protein
MIMILSYDSWFGSQQQNVVPKFLSDPKHGARSKLVGLCSLLFFALIRNKKEMHQKSKEIKKLWLFLMGDFPDPNKTPRKTKNNEQYVPSRVAGKERKAYLQA